MADDYHESTAGRNRPLWTFADLAKMKEAGLTADQMIEVLRIVEAVIAREVPSKAAIRQRRYRDRNRGKRA